MLLTIYLWFTYSAYDWLILLIIYLWITHSTYDVLTLLLNEPSLLTIYLWFTYSTYDWLFLLMIYLSDWASIYPTYDWLLLLMINLWFTYPYEHWFILLMIHLFCLGQSSVQAFFDQVSCCSLITLCHPLVLRDIGLVHDELALPGRY